MDDPSILTAVFGSGYYYYFHDTDEEIEKKRLQ